MRRDDDARIIDWLASGPQQNTLVALQTALAAARTSRQRPAWRVAIAGGTIGVRREANLLRVVALALTVVVLGLAVGGLIAGGMLPRRPPPSVLSIEASPATIQAGLVAYTAPLRQADCSHLAVTCATTQVWVAKTDGSEAHPILGEGGVAMGWSADGARLLVWHGNDLVVTDAGATELARLQIRETCKEEASCPETPPVLCADPCAGADDFALSPDGTRVAFIRSYPDVENASVVTLADLDTGTVTELASTRTTNPPTLKKCNELTTCGGVDGMPRWSLDGRHIAFARQTMSPEAGASWTSAAIYLVDTDGSNLRRVTPSGLAAIDPSWSPDGRRLLFTATEFVVSGDRTAVVDIRANVSAIGVDGTGLTNLTYDGQSSRAHWAANGRVTFVRLLGDASATWTMDARGGTPMRAGASLGQLTAVGCVECIYPLAEFAPGGGYVAYWQRAR
jgi:hypothetical protein